MPIRILLTALITLIGMVTGHLFSKAKGNSDEFEPFNRGSRVVQAFSRVLARGLLWCAGFYWIKFKGQLASSAEAPITVVAPHTTWVDALIFAHLGLKSVVARAESEENGILAPIIRMYKPIVVARTNKDSRQKTNAIISRRVLSGEWPSTVIFPEGTCSNGKSLITFKIGSFTPGVPVQPVLIRYTNKTNFLSWSFKGGSAWKTAVVLYSQFVNFMEIEVLPVYNPSEEEIENPHLFALNVRAYMARHLGIGVCDFSFEDGILIQLAHALHLPDEVGLIGFENIKRTSGFDLRNVKHLLRQFASINSDCDGLLTKAELATYCRVPSTSECMDHIFKVYSRQENTAVITFKEFLLGRRQVLAELEDNSLVEMTFTLMDENGSGEVTIEQFHKVLSTSQVAMERHDAETIFRRYIRKDASTLCIESYKAMLDVHPEYAIFIQRFGSR